LRTLQAAGNTNVDPAALAGLLRTLSQPTGQTDGVSETDRILSMLKRILADKVDKTAVTDSDDEDSCSRSNSRNGEKVRRLVRDDRYHHYAHKVNVINHVTFSQAWKAEVQDLKINGSVLFDDAQRLDAIIERLSRTFKTIRSAHNDQHVAHTTLRGLYKLYTLDVEAFFLLSAMIRCPQRRKEASKSWSDAYRSASEKARTKEEHIVDYTELLRTVIEKHADAGFSGGGRNRGRRNQSRQSRGREGYRAETPQRARSDDKRPDDKSAKK
jgi:hypothetical protein